MAKKCSQKPQGSISTAGMKSMARASGDLLKWREAVEEEKKIIFCCLDPGPGTKNDQKY